MTLTDRIGTVRTYSQYAINLVGDRPRYLSQTELPMPNLPTASSRASAILRAAERLFAQKGFDATTMREIALAADVRLSLVVYHFETKAALYEAVFRSRLHVNEARLGQLRKIDLQADGALERVVSALLDPVLALLDEPEEQWYVRLVLRELSDPSGAQRKNIRAIFDPLAREFVAAFHVILHNREPGFCEWAYLFSLGALTQITQDDRSRSISEDPETPADKKTLLKGYIISALQASLAHNPSARVGRVASPG